MRNKWQFDGEVVKIKEHMLRDTGATLTVRAAAHRDNYMASSIVEINLVVQPDFWEQIKKCGIRLYSQIEAEGHFETWVNVTKSDKLKTRMMYIVDKMVVTEV